MAADSRRPQSEAIGFRAKRATVRCCRERATLTSCPMITVQSGARPARLDATGAEDLSRAYLGPFRPGTSPVKDLPPRFGGHVNT